MTLHQNELEVFSRKYGNTISLLKTSLRFDIIDFSILIYLCNTTPIFKKSITHLKFQYVMFIHVLYETYMRKQLLQKTMQDIMQ